MNVTIEQGQTRADLNDWKEPLKPESFVLNFLQKKKKTKEDGDVCADKLEPKGLACAKYPEHRQRAVVYAILNNNADGLMTFAEFWNLFKYGDVFYKFCGDFGDNSLPIINSSDMNRVNRQKLKLSTDDIAKILELQNFIGDYSINFKHFIV